MSENVAETESEQQEPPIAMPETGGPLILVVEDNPVMQQIIGKLLSRFPVRYHCVGNGLEAIDAAQEKNYALILMDILMPKLGGVRTTKQVRTISSHYADIPVIAVTARVSERDVDQYLAEGMTDVVKKPINKSSLATVLKMHLGVEEATSTSDAQEEMIVSADDLDVLNWETLNEYRLLLKDKFKNFLKDYLTAGPDLLEAINSAIQSGEPENVQFHAHKFKSTSQVFGAEMVSDLAAKLEIMGKNGDISEADKIFLDLHIAYERAQRALTKKLVLLQNM
ncbi:MAG: response regulator [Alphaproteobacteria bacterium]|nr:response regulator [Alphaproteobacteria bacterium]